MDWIWEALGILAAAAVSSVVTWFVARFKARRDAAQWTLEQVSGAEWTIRRDSPRPAFNMNVFGEGSAAAESPVRMLEYFPRGDVPAGASARIGGIDPGAIVQLDWVERDSRLSAQALIREGSTKIVLTRADVRPVIG